jgi:uncharacterized LabA/DUF88 family protein
LPQQDRLNIAVFIDFDNIEIGVKNTLGQQFDVGLILDAIKERGEVVTKIAYADWTRAGEYSRTLTQHAIRLVQRNLTPGGDKNGADINLALDALEMAFTHQHINAYVIVGGDSDFLSLVEKLKQYDKKIFVVGGRAFTSVILQRNCHEFIAYENLHGVRKQAARTGRPMPAAAANLSIAQAFPIVRRALKILADREVTPQTGLLKSTLLQLDSTFSERNYGASSFLDFVEKLAQGGLVQLKTSGRSVMVELTAGDAEKSDAAVADAGGSEGDAAAQAGGPGAAAAASAAAPAPPPIEPAGDQAAGVQQVARILAAAQNPRWPMYLRNFKQILRAADGGFDERRYGFGGLMDLMRACQREGLIRLERDRRGGLRVFQGSSTPRSQPPTAHLPQPDVADEQPRDESVGSGRPLEPRGSDEEPVDFEPMPTIDPTAELLGRAKPRRPRARAAAQPAGTGTATSAKAKKPRASTGRKSAKPRSSADPS